MALEFWISQLGQAQTPSLMGQPEKQGSQALPVTFYVTWAGPSLPRSSVSPPVK